MSKKNKEYAPKERTDYNPTKNEVGFGAANPKTDSVVTNNISTSEFDYTEDQATTNKKYQSKNK